MDVKLPKLGEGADSGVVVNLFVKEGDTVAKDQAILELENEKAVASIPSTGAGVVAKIYVKPGDRIGIGQRILTLTESGQPACRACRRWRAVRAAAPRSACSGRGRGRGRERGEQLPRLRRWPRRRCAKWRGNWALICGRFAAARRAGGSGWRTCGIIFSG